MTLRGSHFAIVFFASALAGCNNSHLVAGATCAPAAASSAIESADAAPTRVMPVVAAQAATAANATALLTAMDADPSAFTNVSYTGNAKQAAVFNTLVTVTPVAGSNFAWLSTGVAGAGTPSTLDPLAFNTQLDLPGQFGGAGCGATSSGTPTFDCATLAFTFIVPDGLHSVAFDFNFMSTEYPEYVNAGYNDSFVVSMSSPSHSYTNVVFDHNGNPINIDSLLFSETCGQLAGTGFEITGGSGCDAGATGMLTTTSPVEPGETVTMKFSIMDAGDSALDSAVMIDNLRVSPEPVGTPNTGTPTPTPGPTPTPDACQG